MVVSLDEQNPKVVTAKILKGRPYTYPALRPLKGKEIAKLESKEEYLFDISKVDQIFDHLIKDQQIKLPEGHKIPFSKELNNKKYYKWHHSYSHATVNCVVFENVIQKALKERRFKIVDRGMTEMTIDTDLFPNATTNMISTSGLNFHPRTDRGK